MRQTILAILLFLPFCISQAQQAPIDVHGFNKTLQLEELLTPIDLQSDILMVQGVTSDDKYLYVYNRKETPIVKAYRLTDGMYMGGFGSIGKGPGEYDPFLFSSSFNARNGQIITQDMKYVRILNVKESADRLSFEMVKEVRMPPEWDIVNQGILLKDDLYAGSIMFTEKDFVTFPLSDMSLEERNSRVGSFGDFPQEYPDVPFNVYHELYQGMSSFAYNGNALVRYYSRLPMLRLFRLPSGDYLDIPFKPKNAQIKNVKLNKSGRGIENGLDMINYFSNVQMGREFIVASYQEGKYRRVAMTGMGNLERVPLTDKYVLVLSTEGELLAKLTPPEWMGWFHVTPKDQLIVFHPEISDQLFMVDLNQFK
ncbi:MAG: hypothetical protein HWE21_01415 [Cytophagia bacterium]|nr:hypothetical protein [Cytophagia bacterium]